MKKLIRRYIGVSMYTICGVLIILSSYSILINLNHATYLNKKVFVSDMDNDYKIYKENILKIEENINNKNDYISQKIKSSLSIIKNDGVYTLVPGDRLSYIDLYNLNNYFINDLINKVWISNLKLINELDNDYYNEFMNNLIHNANYLDKELLNNSNIHYHNDDLRDEIDEEYRYILNNYKEFSFLILKISNIKGDNNV